MTEITSRTVWEVDGQQFDSEDAAKAHAAAKSRQSDIAEYIYENTCRNRVESADAAEVLVAHWTAIKAIMEQPR